MLAECYGERIRCFTPPPISLTIEELENYDSEADNYVTEEFSESETSLCEGLREVGFRKAMARRVLSILQARRRGGPRG